MKHLLGWQQLACVMKHLFILILICASVDAALVKSYKDREIESCIGSWHAWDYDSENSRYVNNGRSQKGTSLFMQEPALSVFRPYRVIGNSGNIVSFAQGTGNSIAGASSSASAFAGDMDVRVDASLNNWNGISTLAAKDSNTLCWYFSTYMGSLQFKISTNGSSYLNNSLNYAYYWIPDGSRTNVRATVQQVSTNIVTALYIGANIDSGPWTQLGLAVTNFGNGTTNIFTNVSAIFLGASGNANSVDGKIYGFRLYNGVNGTLVSSFDSSLLGQTGYTDVNTSPNTAWSLNRAGVTAANIILRTNDTSAVWLSNPANSNHLFCSDNSLLNFGTASSGTWFALVRNHVLPSNARLLCKKPVLASSAGYELGMVGAFQPYVRIGDGVNNVIGATSASTAPSGTLALLSCEIDSSKITNWTDSVPGSSGLSRTTVGSITSSSNLYLMQPPDLSASYGTEAEITAAGIVARKLTAKELTRLKWELSARGSKTVSGGFNRGFN